MAIYRCICDVKIVQECDSPQTAVTFFAARFAGVRPDVLEILDDGYWVRLDFYLRVQREGVSSACGRQYAMLLTMPKSADTREGHHVDRWEKQGFGSVRRYQNSATGEVVNRRNLDKRLS